MRTKISGVGTGIAKWEREGIGIKQEAQLPQRERAWQTDKLKPYSAVIGLFRSIWERKLTFRRAKRPTHLLCNSEQITEIVSLCIGLVHEGRFYGFSRTIICSAMILGPKWSNTKLVYLLRPSAIMAYKQHWRAPIVVRGCLSIMHSFSVISANFAINLYR